MGLGAVHKHLDQILMAIPQHTWPLHLYRIGEKLSAPFTHTQSGTPLNPLMPRIELQVITIRQ